METTDHDQSTATQPTLQPTQSTDVLGTYCWLG